MSTTGLVLWALLAGIVSLLVMAALRPDSFRIERSALLAATPDVVAGHITDFRQWAHWSPWEKLDPGMQRSYRGVHSGVGAVYDWTGNGKAGAGRMEITDVDANRIVIRIDFFKPFAASNTVEFTLQAQGSSTQLSWAMFGPSPFVSKLMGMVFNIDKMVGKDFEAGLANLQARIKPV